ncbi:MAG: hypothetical protein ACYCZB_15960, partial [Acidiphilium sp.]
LNAIGMAGNLLVTTPNQMTAASGKPTSHAPQTLVLMDYIERLLRLPEGMQEQWQRPGQPPAPVSAHRAKS